MTGCKPPEQTWDGKAFTANKVKRHGCYQPTPMGNTPYGHSIIITEIMTWVQGRLGLVALHDRVQTTTTTLDSNAFTASKVWRHGCYQSTPIWNTPHGHSTFITEILTWVHGRLGLVAVHDRVQTITNTPMVNTPYGHSTFITEILKWVHGGMGWSSTTWQGEHHHEKPRQQSINSQ